MKPEELVKLRKEIAEVDKNILDLIAKRIDIATKIGKYKMQKNLPIRNYQFEKQVINRSRVHAEKIGLSPNLADRMIRLLIQEAVGAQNKFLNQATQKIVRGPVSLQKGVAYSGTDTFQFNPLGELNSDSTELVTFSKGNYQVSVQVSPVGRIRMIE